MAKISGKETKPEILVRKYLFSKGYRYRKNVKTLPGSPDIVLSKYKTVIFINGCFWHGHNCKRAKLPETRKEIWDGKIRDNIGRDKRNTITLETLGWNVITIWQCEFSKMKVRKESFTKLENQILVNIDKYLKI